VVLNLYRFIVCLCAPLLYVLGELRALKGREERARLPERRGLSNIPRPESKIIWIHAASVGETRSVFPLIEKLLNANTNATCLITTVTLTAAQIIKNANNPRIIHQYSPFDHPRWCIRFLNHWKPCAVLWVESELWPTMLESISTRKIPLMMINGRLSDRSSKRWQKFPHTIAKILGFFDICAAQSETDATRLKTLGGTNVITAGNLKYAGTSLPFDADALEKLKTQINNRPCLLFASTHVGEEDIALRVHKALASKHPQLLSIIMPRHPQRGGSIAALCNAPYAIRSKNQIITHDTQIYIADTLGEPGLFYRLCPIVYLGNGLIPNPGGGHNPIEPAQLGCAIVYGPHMFNFSEIDSALRAQNAAFMIDDESALTQTLDNLLTNKALCQKTGNAALNFVSTQNTVLEKTCEALRPHLEHADISL
jgi:3-deoxy-D-manno-octulosonic-acid transferase